MQGCVKLYNMHNTTLNTYYLFFKKKKDMIKVTALFAYVM